MTLSPQWLDELRARVTLSTVVGRTVRLQKAGREYRACCPFHEEKTPSFYVNDAKGFYHCFGCEAHGDVIRWLTDQRGLPFMDAVKELAAEAGMELPTPDPRAVEEAQRRAGLHDVMAAAQEWFALNLRSSAGARARDYLATRNFSPDTLKAFGFGYAPADKTGLKEALAHFRDPLLIEAGLLIQVDGKPPYDRFRERLMLPIRDPRGRVIAFGGRLLEQRDNAPKYLNSPDTPLFDKGRNLYNLDRAAPAARQTGRLVVAEGYMDVIALATAGIAEAVAPMGTALTEMQIELLWRQVECPVLCFDGDAAGQRAAMRAAVRALPLLRPGHTLRVARLPGGKDPDDLVREQGRQAVEAVLVEAAPLADVLWHGEFGAAPLDSPEAKAGLKERLLAHVDTIGHPDIKALYRRDLLSRFSEFAFPPRTPRQHRPERPGGAPVARSASAALKRHLGLSLQDELACAVMHGFARHPGLIDTCAELLIRYARRRPDHAPAVEQLLELSESQQPDSKEPTAPLPDVPAPAEPGRYRFLADGVDEQDARSALQEAATLLVEAPEMELALAAATARFAEDPEGAFAEQQRLLQRKLEIDSRVRHIRS